jgi:hypothetical protein
MHHATETYWGVEVQLHAFLALDAGVLSHVPATLLTDKEPWYPLEVAYINHKIPLS